MPKTTKSNAYIPKMFADFKLMAVAVKQTHKSFLVLSLIVKRYSLRMVCVRYVYRIVQLQNMAHVENFIYLTYYRVAPLYFLQTFWTIENDDDDDDFKQHENATPTHSKIRILQKLEKRTTITTKNINGIGKCQANSSYVDDHVIRITNHIIPLTWMHAALHPAIRYIKRYADDSPAWHNINPHLMWNVFWFESK